MKSTFYILSHQYLLNEEYNLRTAQNAPDSEVYRRIFTTIIVYLQ